MIFELCTPFVRYALGSFMDGSFPTCFVCECKRGAITDFSIDELSGQKILTF